MTEQPTTTDESATFNGKTATAEPTVNGAQTTYRTSFSIEETTKASMTPTLATTEQLATNEGTATTVVPTITQEPKITQASTKSNKFKKNKFE